MFSKKDSANYSYKVYTITEVIHDTIPSCRNNSLPERYNQNFLRPIKLSLEQYNQVIKKLNLFQKKTMIRNGTRKWHSESTDPAKALDLFLAKQTNRKTKNFVHTEVRTLDPRLFSTMLLPTEL